MTTTRAGGPEARADRWRRVEALYHEILARAAPERAAAFLAAGPDDPALAAEVRALLDQGESAAGLLATPALEVAAKHVPPTPITDLTLPALDRLIRRSIGSRRCSRSRTFSRPAG